MAFPYSFNRILNTLQIGIFNDNSASSRINTGFGVLNRMFDKVSLFLFGTGYGNGNMYDAIGINTADNMYINMFAWCGILAFAFYLAILFKLLKRTTQHTENPMRKGAFFATVFLLVAGLTIETLNEPTIGAMFMLVYGLFEIVKQPEEKESQGLPPDVHSQNSYILYRGKYGTGNPYIK